MEFKILNKVPINPSYLDAFVVEVKLMHGDADFYETIKIGVFKRNQDEDLLIELLKQVMMGAKCSITIKTEVNITFL